MHRKMFVMLVTLMLAGTVAMAQQQVSVDFDRTYDYSKVKTFGIQIASSWGNPLGEKRVLDEVSGELVGKGWVKSDEGTPDAMVMIHGATENKRRLNAMYSGGGWRFGGTGSIQEQDYTVGTLIVDIFDSGTKALLFRGTAQDELATSVDKNTKKLDKATTKMFKDFPPVPAQKKK